MLQRLDYDEDKPEEQRRKPEVIRREFDHLLGVDQWEAPMTPAYARDSQRDPGAPSWWVSDEEASQSFLAAMGVRL